MFTLGSSRPMFLSDRMKNVRGPARMSHHQGLGLTIPSVNEHKQSNEYKRRGVPIIVGSTITEEGSSRANELLYLLILYSSIICRQVPIVN